MSRYHEVVLSNRLDDVIEEGVKQAMSAKKLKKQGQFKKVGIGLAAGFAITMGIGFTNPAVASKLPVVGNVFEAIEKNLSFPGHYSEYATSINETAYSNGIGITLSEILCDGQFLYVTYMVESEEPFPYRSYEIEERGGEVIEVNQLLLGEAYTEVDFKSDLELVGMSGLEGKFIDEHTFVGVEQYDLGASEVPDEFMFKTKKIVVENDANNSQDQDQIVWGTWAFNVPVKVNQELSTTIELEGIEENGASVQAISMTPFGVIVEATLPETDWSKYDVLVYDEAGNSLHMSQLNYLENQQAVRGIYTAPIGQTSNLRVVIQKQIWVPTGENSYTHNESETILDQVMTIQ